MNTGFFGSKARLLARMALATACISAATSMSGMVGCGSSKEQTKTAEADPASGSVTNEAVQTESDGSGAIERIDVNADGKPDVFKYYRVVDAPAATASPEADPKKNVKSVKKVLIRKELDVNFDQRIDIVQFYEGEAGKEALVREEMDLDFDGRVDSVRHYKDGNVTLVELDLGFDGRTDTWSYYQLTTGDDGKQINRLVERRRDANGDGKIDVWEYYTKGALLKVGTDTNGDGQPDQYTRVDDKK